MEPTKDSSSVKSPELSSFCKHAENVKNAKQEGQEANWVA